MFYLYEMGYLYLKIVEKKKTKTTNIDVSSMYFLRKLITNVLKIYYYTNIVKKKKKCCRTLNLIN